MIEYNKYLLDKNNTINIIFYFRVLSIKNYYDH